MHMGRVLCVPNVPVRSLLLPGSIPTGQIEEAASNLPQARRDADQAAAAKPKPGPGRGLQPQHRRDHLRPAGPPSAPPRLRPRAEPPRRVGGLVWPETRAAGAEDRQPCPRASLCAANLKGHHGGSGDQSSGPRGPGWGPPVRGHALRGHRGRGLFSQKRGSRQTRTSPRCAGLWPLCRQDPCAPARGSPEMREEV